MSAPHNSASPFPEVYKITRLSFSWSGINSLMINFLMMLNPFEGSGRLNLNIERCFHWENYCAQIEIASPDRGTDHVWSMHDCGMIWACGSAHVVPGLALTRLDFSSYMALCLCMCPDLGGSLTMARSAYEWAVNVFVLHFVPPRVMWTPICFSFCSLPVWTSLTISNLSFANFFAFISFTCKLKDG